MTYNTDGLLIDEFLDKLMGGVPNPIFEGEQLKRYYKERATAKAQLNDLLREARIDELKWALEYHRSTPNPPLAREYFAMRLAQLQDSASGEDCEYCNGLGKAYVVEGDEKILYPCQGCDGYGIASQSKKEG